MTSTSPRSSLRPPEVSGGRSYQQWCSLAVALDVVGERWTLLVVRELLTGPKRYTDLRASLPGIATNILATRLAKLEAHGLVERRVVAPPTPATVYELTQEGRTLEEVVIPLIRWGGRLMPGIPWDRAFRTHWVPLALSAFLRMRPGDDVELACDVRVDGEEIHVRARDGRVEILPGLADRADAVITGDAQGLLAVASGNIPLEQAERRGLLSFEGPAWARGALARLTPKPDPAPPSPEPDRDGSS